MMRGGSAPITLPLAHPAWKRAALRAAAGFGRRSLRPPAAVRLIAETCDCAAPLGREIMAAAEHYGLITFTGGRWSVAEPAAGTAPAATPNVAKPPGATRRLLGANPCDNQ